MIFLCSLFRAVEVGFVIIKKRCFLLLSLRDVRNLPGLFLHVSVPGDLGFGANISDPADLFLGQLETEGGLDFFNDLLEGKTTSRLLVEVPGVGVALPFAAQGHGPDELLPGQTGHPGDLRTKHIPVSPDLLQNTQADLVLLSKWILDDLLALQEQEDFPGKR